MKHGYCPWCGEQIEPIAMFAITEDIEWGHCRTFGCRGRRLDVITDKLGYVIHPRHIRGNYIYSKLTKE